MHALRRFDTCQYQHNKSLNALNVLLKFFWALLQTLNYLLLSV